MEYLYHKMYQSGYMFIVLSLFSSDIAVICMLIKLENSAKTQLAKWVKRGDYTGKRKRWAI